MNRLGELLVYLLVTLATIFWGGFIFMRLWGWFVVSTFSLPQLSWYQSMGIILLVEFFKSAKQDTKQATLESIVDHFGFTACWSGFILLLGWILSFYV